MNWDTFNPKQCGVFGQLGIWGGGGTVRQAVGEVQSLELHQYKVARVVSTIMIKNKVFLQYIMVFNEILSHNLYLFV